MRRVVALALALVGTMAQAHDPLPNTQWCSTGRAYAVAQFQFTPAQIQAYADCLRAGTCLETSPTARGGDGGCSTQHCGEFDDYGAARRMAYNGCSAYSQPAPTRGNPDRGSAIELISSPATFNSATHHADYTAGQGLDGQCVRCGDIALTPPPNSTR